MLSDTASKNAHPTIKAFALKASECLELNKDACAGVCAYKNGRCEVSDVVGEKMLIEMIKASSKDCGPIIQWMIAVSCEAKTKTDCTDTCEYHEKGAYEFDEKSKSCKLKQIPVCKKKKDAEGQNQIEAICPDMDAVKKECNAKGDMKLTMDCYGKKCPIMLLSMGIFTCGMSFNEQACRSNGNLCAYDGTKCAVNNDYVLDLFIPKTCWMRPLIDESTECEKAKTENACKGKCEWKTTSSCANEQVSTTTKCDINGDSIILSFLSQYAVRQQELCTGSKTESACTQVTAAPDRVARAASDDSVAKTLIYTIMILFVELIVIM